ncbi:hypothetical protein Z951_39990 [Streptomyces sp. PRh5]|uniref:hypothetical protein n=1 Tax=Streptomyces sp. PRh5 TaxID=1158056 RepID=UPI0004470ABE|nr:hypothetical protein [Streptomyces sp. PRh5]EXU62693.1 hypothetical protein Z951_39990 [Streptomyces sp. PRh5]
MADAARDQRVQAQVLYELGSTQYAMGQADDAKGFLIRAHPMRANLGDRRGVALTEICLGQIRLDAEQPIKAIDHFAKARTTLGEKDPFDAARALAWMGRANARLGNFPQATRLLERAKKEFGEIRSPRWIARTLDMLRQTAEEQGHVSRASRFYKTSLEQYELINLRDVERVRQRLRELAE